MILCFLALISSSPLSKPLKIVENPVSTGPYTIELVEDLRLGEQAGHDHHIWLNGQEPVMVDANANGFIYITDPGNNRILEFKPDGSFSRVIGAEGQGPGEYSSLRTFQVFSDGQAIGFDHSGGISTLNFYSTKQEYLYSLTYLFAEKGLKKVTFDPEMKYVLVRTYLTDWKTRTRKRGVSLQTSAFEPVRTHFFNEYESEDRMKAQTKEFWVDVFAGNIAYYAKSTRLFWAFLPDGSYLISRKGSDYVVEYWSPGGQKFLREIRKDYEPIPFVYKDRQALADWYWQTIYNTSPELERKLLFTKQVFRDAAEKAELPLVKKPIFDILALEDGHFLVVHDAGFLMDHFKADIFDPEGVCMGRMTFPGRGLRHFSGGVRVIFKNGYAYAVETNQDDEEVVVRYRYKLVKR